MKPAGRRTGFLVLVFFWLVLGNAGVMHACKCAEHALLTPLSCTPYDLIFEGRVDSLGTGKDSQTFVYFTVSALYKGESLNRVEIRYDNTSDCAMSFQKGEQWILYAQYYKYGKASVDFCSRSRKEFLSGDDYYASSNGMSYAQEQAFLKKTFGMHSLKQQVRNDIPTRVLVQPSAYWKLWLLLISVLVMYLIIYFVKKLP